MCKASGVIRYQLFYLYKNNPLAALYYKLKFAVIFYFLSRNTNSSTIYWLMNLKSHIFTEKLISILQNKVDTVSVI